MFWLPNEPKDALMLELKFFMHALRIDLRILGLIR